VKYLLDTNVVIGLLANRPSIVTEMRRRSLSEIALSSLVMHELYFGAYKGARTVETLRNYGRLVFSVLPFETDDARFAAEIRAILQRQGTPIGPYDTLLAGQALARGLVLVTRNTREFARVEGLQVENWEV
jgi:tRNA(fMet)-specific endonuclease VapC